MRENHSFLHMGLFCLFVGFLNQNSTKVESDVKNAEDPHKVGQCKKEPVTWKKGNAAKAGVQMLFL